MSLVHVASKIQVSLSVQKALSNVKAQPDIGFTQITDRKDLLQNSAELATILKTKYSHFVVIGIGGSSAGPRALTEIAGASHVDYLDNVDSSEFSKIIKKISNLNPNLNVQDNLKKVGFILISKSGSTIEVQWNYSALEQYYKSNELSLVEQCVFITEPVNNDLSRLAKKYQRPLLEIPLDVGGRFSVLTPVGLLIGQLCDYKLEDLFAGASLALKSSREVETATQIFLDSFKRGENLTLFWFYNSNFRWFGNWLQQLWAESLGKKTTRSGSVAPHFSTPFIAIGSCDQHSILQQIAHSTDKNKLACFFSFASVENSDFKLNEIPFESIQFLKGHSYGDLIKSQARATEQALHLNSVSTAQFQVDDLNKSQSLGFLFMYFQLIVATIGEHEDVNAYDQPGVALGKELTLELLKK